MSGDITQEIVLVVIMVLAFVPAIVFHECAHGFAAYKLGDPTAKNAGRLTLNPIAHVDLVGTVLLPGLLILMSAMGGGAGFFFGYAKPVPYNPRYFKNIRVGEVVVGLAGPASNIVMAVIGAVVAHAATMLLYTPAADITVYVWYFGVYFCQVNLCLAFFNLIPLPPLDGSSIIAPLLSDKALQKYYQVQQYAMFFLILLIFVVPYFTNIDIIGIYLDVTAGNIANMMLG